MLRIFKHYVPTSLILLMLVEIAVLYFSFYGAVQIRFIDSAMLVRHKLDPLAPKASIFALVMFFSMTAVGLHTRNLENDFADVMIRIFLSYAMGFIGITMVYYVYPELFAGRGIVALTLLISFFGILITRIIYQKIYGHKIFRRKILVLGTGNKAKILEDMKSRFATRGLDIVGFISVNLDIPKIKIDQLVEVKSTIFDHIISHDIDEVVIAMDDRRQGFPVVELLQCKMYGIEIWDIVGFLERATGHIELNALHPSDFIFSDTALPGIGKRAIDIIVSFTILLITSPIMILTAAMIWLSTLGRDPVFYRQTRVGNCGQPFQVLKFRSMKVNAEENGAQFAVKKDSRVTLIGKLIRKMRIDELPQLINVLRGDMSFVGPRPERPEFVSTYEQNIPHYKLRHTVKPGITGWAQISYPYGDTEKDTRNKLQYDLYYIKNYGVFFDLTIVVQTMQVVLFGQGAR